MIMMMNRTANDNAAVLTLQQLSPQETEGSMMMVMPPAKPIRQTTLHKSSSHEKVELQPPSSSFELDMSLYASFHMSFSKQESFNSVTAPSKPVRQKTLSAEGNINNDDSMMLLNSCSHHSSTSHASSSSSSRFNSLFEIVTMDQDNHEMSLSVLRYATTPPSQPVRQVTSGVMATAIAAALPPPPLPIIGGHLELNRQVSSASKKPRVTNCKFSKTSLLDDDDDDEEVEEEETSIDSRANKGFGLPSPSRSHHPSLGMSLSCMTLRGTASAPSMGPPPLPVRQISSDGHVVVNASRRASKTRGLHDNNKHMEVVPATPRRLDRLCATESACSASPPARPIRQVSRPMNVALPQLPSPPHLAPRTTTSSSSMLLPPPLPRRQVTTTQMKFVVPPTEDSVTSNPVFRSTSQPLIRDVDPLLLPPSKPVRQVSGDASVPMLVVVQEPSTTRPTAHSVELRRSKRPSVHDRRPKEVYDDDKLQGRTVTAPLTPLPSVKASMGFPTRMMPPSSSSNASSSSSSRSSLTRHRRNDFGGGPLRQ